MDRTPQENPHAFADAVESGKEHFGFPLPKDVENLRHLDKSNPDLEHRNKQEQPGESESKQG
ncbi:hypothetical protein KW783_00760 [Candidatus Parcubacteria bacterium]|nr:hypothetical protein [Candidatus Parcubacteria bacterium]